MFLFCKWFSKLNCDEEFRNNVVVSEILNQSGENQWVISVLFVAISLPNKTIETIVIVVVPIMIVKWILFLQGITGT